MKHNSEVRTQTTARHSRCRRCGDGQFPSCSFVSFVVGLTFLAALIPACSHKPDDAKISSEIQSRFNQDSGLSSKQLSVQSANGVVTLSGNVDNDAQRDAAGRQAASVDGVKTVVNNLIIGLPQNAKQSAAVPPTQSSNTPPRDPFKPAPAKKPAKLPVAVVTLNPAPDAAPSAPTDQSVGKNQPAPPPQDNVAAAPANPPADQPPPDPPRPKQFIIDQGTQITVRLIDPIDSEKNQTGDTFHATLNAPLSSDGEEAVPAGIELTGHLVEVKSASQFAGQASVTMQLDSLSSGGRTYSLQTDQYKKQGNSQGKSTAEKVGGGAVIGGIIGALAGGGKGAAIGAGAGAGVGGGVQAAGKNKNVKLPSETVLSFTLQAPITVVKAPSPDANRPKLGMRNEDAQ
jgi:hypothetical protein